MHEYLRKNDKSRDHYMMAAASSWIRAAQNRIGLSSDVVDRIGEVDSIRSEEHTSELQSRPHISYAVFCLKKKKTNTLTGEQTAHHH